MKPGGLGLVPLLITDPNRSTGFNQARPTEHCKLQENVEVNTIVHHPGDMRLKPHNANDGDTYCKRA